MSLNRNDYGKSMQMLIIGVSIFSSFCFALLVYAFIDNLFFGNELSAYIATLNRRFMIGLIMIPIFSGGAFIMYWGTRSNISFINAFFEKLGMTNKHDTEQFSASGTERKAKDYAKTDDTFNNLLRRFYGYLRGISGSGQFNVRQALDLNSRIGRSTMAIVMQLGLGIIPFIMVLGSTNTYVSKVYQAEYNDIIKSALNTRPQIAFSVIAIFALTLLFVFFKFIRSIIEKVLIPIMNLGNTVLSTEKIDPWGKNYFSFLHETHFQIYFPWRAYLYPIVIVCAVLPLLIGIILMNYVLIYIGGTCFLGGLLLKRYDSGKGKWFRFYDINTLEIGNGIKVKRLPIDSIEEVVVHYQSIKDRSIQISSTSALMRSLISRKVLNELIDGPQLIPSTITFFTENGSGYVIPLRFLTRNGKEVHSHEIEFFIAIWLKSNGYQFQLVESEEDAGDWRAFK